MSGVIAVSTTIDYNTGRPDIDRGCRGFPPETERGQKATCPAHRANCRRTRTTPSEAVRLNKTAVKAPPCLDAVDHGQLYPDLAVGRPLPFCRCLSLRAAF